MLNVTKVLRCSSFNDTFINWSSTPANSTVSSRCPESLGAPFNARAYRYCHSSGKWTDENGIPVTENIDSYTNFAECISDEMKNIINSNFTEITKFVYYNFCFVALIGLLIGILTLSLSVVILQKYRHLRNHRTRIHKQLFVALLIEAFIQLVFYSELMVEELEYTSNNTITEITSPLKNIIWNIRICIYEYLTTSVFLWMLIEGIHIHNIIAVNVFHGRYRFNCYLFLGWIIPIPVTVIWMTCMNAKYTFLAKWIFLHQIKIYWILSSFRLSCIFINLWFLINVIRVLILRMRTNNCPELCQIKRAVKAAVFLIPLLGVVNFVQILKADIDTAWFLILSFLQVTMPSWQGFLVSIIYCLVNKDVLQAVRHSYTRYKTRQGMNSGTKMTASSISPKGQCHSNTRAIECTLLSNMDVKSNDENLIIKCNGF